MKQKFILVLLAMLMVLPSYGAMPKSEKREDNKKEVKALIKEYNRKKGFKSNEVSGLGLTVFKALLDSGKDDPEYEEAVKEADSLATRDTVSEDEAMDLLALMMVNLVKNADSMLTLEVDSTAAATDIETFAQRLNEILSDSELLITRDSLGAPKEYVYIRRQIKEDNTEIITQYIKYLPKSGYTSCMWGEYLPKDILFEFPEISK